MRLLLPLAACLITAPWIAAAEPAPAEGTVIVQLSGAFPLCASGLPFSAHEETRHDAALRLQRALAAPEPRVVLDCSAGFAPGIAGAEELAAVIRTRKGAKVVACLLDAVEDDALIVAAACDEVVMAEAGVLLVDGLAISTDYYAAALAKLGVRFHAVSSGPAKTAPEPLTRNAPSPAAIAEIETLVGALDAVLVAQSVRGRFDAAALTRARASAPQIPGTALSLHLVDAIAEPGAWLRDQPQPVRWEETAEDEPDLSSLPGMLAFWTRLLEGDQPRTGKPKVVAVVELEGDLVDNQVSEPGSTIGFDTVDLFADLADDERVVAVVVRINSPGGAAGCSDRIHHAIRRLRDEKPVVALFDDVAASGGYYLGCAADRILVHRGTITGSIGVFAVLPDLSGTRDLLGITRHTVTSGPRAALFETGALTPDKEAAVRQLIGEVDGRFQGLVAATRKLPAPKVAELAGGRVYTGEQAVANGLADGFGTLASAVAAARGLADEAEPLPLERYPRRQGLAAWLGLGSGVRALLPARVRQWTALATRNVPAVLAWSPWQRPR